MIQFIGEDNGTSNDLPWLKDWINLHQPPYNETAVISVHKSAKGCLVITHQWKAFIFRGTTLYTHLIEALDIWIGATDVVPYLVAIPTESGKTRLGINHDQTIAYWTKEGQAYHQKLQPGDGPAASGLVENPLLAQPIPTNRRSRAGTKPAGA